MTERDPFEDVLARFRPVGPPQDMQPPVLLRNSALARPPGHIRRWVAGGLLLTAAAAGASWLWSDRDAARESSLTRAASARAAAPIAQGRDAPIVIGGDIPEPDRIHTVLPLYSADPDPGLVAVLELTVSPDGRVNTVKALRGQERFFQEASEAAVQWRYEPVQLGGEAVWFVITVVVWHPFR